MGFFFTRGGTGRFLSKKGGTHMFHLLSRLWHEEDGQGMVEYALIIALIAIVVIVALGPLGKRIAALFQSTTDNLPEAAETTP
jgi:pilus assembly protein Flp/PilA